MRTYDLTGSLASTVATGAAIPAHDKTADLAETIGGLLTEFRDYVAEVRDGEQANAAVAELGRAIAHFTSDGREEGMPALVLSDDANGLWSELVNRMRPYAVTVTEHDGTTYEGHVYGVERDEDGMPELVLGATERAVEPGVRLDSERIRQVFVH